MAPFWEPRGGPRDHFFPNKIGFWLFLAAKTAPGDSRGPRSCQNGAARLPKWSPQKGAQETLRHPKNEARTLQKVAETSTLPRPENPSRSCRHNEPKLTQNSDSSISKWSPKDCQSCQNDAQDIFRSKKCLPSQGQKSEGYSLPTCIATTSLTQKGGGGGASA